MGQRIEISQTAILANMAFFTMDRTITGQDGSTFVPEQQTTDSSLPARLASELFGVDEAIVKVFTSSNIVSVERRGGWTDDAVASVGAVMSQFLVYY